MRTVHTLLAEIGRVEGRIRAYGRALDEHERKHADLDGRVRRLESELDELRQARTEAYSRWWKTREHRDHSRHVARRLRRRLNRLQRRLAPYGELADG